MPYPSPESSARRRPAPAPARRGAAFTLLELIVVVVIMAIVAAVAVPMAIGTGDLQVISACRLIATDLQYAQNVAITHQEEVTAAFSPSTESYSLSNESGPLIHPMTKEAYTVDFRSRDGFHDLDIVSADFGGSPSVTFEDLGAPDEAGAIQVQSGPHLYRIDVAAATGKVTVTAVNP